MDEQKRSEWRKAYAERKKTSRNTPRRRLPQSTAEIEAEARLSFQVTVSAILVAAALLLVFLPGKGTAAFREKLKYGIEKKVTVAELRESAWIDSIFTKAEQAFAGFGEQDQKGGVQEGAEQNLDQDAGQNGKKQEGTKTGDEMGSGSSQKEEAEKGTEPNGTGTIKNQLPPETTLPES